MSDLDMKLIQEKADKLCDQFGRNDPHVKLVIHMAVVSGYNIAQRYVKDKVAS